MNVLVRDALAVTVAADLEFIVAMSTTVGATLAVTSLWLGATLWSARGEVT